MPDATHPSLPAFMEMVDAAHFNGVTVTAQDRQWASFFANMSEPWWGPKSTPPMRCIGYVIGYQTPGHVYPRYRYDYDQFNLLHVNYEPRAGVNYHVRCRGDESTKYQYWTQMTNRHLDAVPHPVVDTLTRMAAIRLAPGETDPYDSRGYALARLRELQRAEGWGL